MSAELNRNRSASNQLVRCNRQSQDLRALAVKSGRGSSTAGPGCGIYKPQGTKAAAVVALLAKASFFSDATCCFVRTLSAGFLTAINCQCLLLQNDMLKAKESTRPTVNEKDLKQFEEFTKDFGMEGWSRLDPERGVVHLKRLIVQRYRSSAVALPSSLVAFYNRFMTERDVLRWFVRVEVNLVLCVWPRIELTYFYVLFGLLVPIATIVTRDSSFCHKTSRRPFGIASGVKRNFWLHAMCACTE